MDWSGYLLCFIVILQYYDRLIQTTVFIKFLGHNWIRFLWVHCNIAILR